MGTTARHPGAVGRLWFAAAALLALPLCIDATGDPDLWWHLRQGQWIADNHAIPRVELFSYTSAGTPQVDHEWLAELLFWAVHNAIGVAGLAVVVGIVTWSGLLALAAIARGRGATGLAIGVVLLLGAKTLQPVTGTRPQMLTFALLCWSLYIVDRHVRRGGRAVWWLVPMTVLWANLHAGFAVGLAVVGIAVAAAGVDAAVSRTLTPALRRRLLMAIAAVAAAAAAALLNPFGADLYRFAILGSVPAAHQLIQEWQPPDLTSTSGLPLLVLLLGTAAVIALGRRRVRPSHVILAVLGAVAGLIAVRNTAIAVALLSPTLAELLPVRYRLPASAVLLPAAALAAALVALAVSITRLSLDTRATVLARTWPSCLVADLQAAAGGQRLWLPYGQAGLAIEQGWPQVRVYAYGNDAALGPSVVIDEVRIGEGVTSEPSAVTLLDSSATTAVITPPGALSAALDQGGWHRVASSAGETLFASPGGTGVRATAAC